MSLWLPFLVLLLFLGLVPLLQSSIEVLAEDPLDIPDLGADANHVSLLTTAKAPACLPGLPLRPDCPCKAEGSVHLLQLPSNLSSTLTLWSNSM